MFVCAYASWCHFFKLEKSLLSVSLKGYNYVIYAINNSLWYLHCYIVQACSYPNKVIGQDGSNTWTIHVNPKRVEMTQVYGVNLRRQNIILSVCREQKFCNCDIYYLWKDREWPELGIYTGFERVSFVHVCSHPTSFDVMHLTRFLAFFLTLVIILITSRSIISMFAFHSV